MRLLDIKRNICIAYEEFEYTQDTYNSLYRINNIQGIKLALQEMQKSGFYKREQSALIENILSSHSDYMLFNADQINYAINELKRIKGTIETFYYWVKEYLSDDEDDTTINIKLPTLCKIDDLTKASTIINKALSQSVSEIGGEVKIKHLDYGSSWIIITLGTALAANLAVTLANAAFTIAQKYFGIKMMQQQYERYNMGTEILRTVKEANEKIIAVEIRTLAENVEKEFYPESDNERIERIRVSISEMAKLIELGGEVHPSLIAASNNEIKSPDYKSLTGILKSIGELPRSGSPNSENSQEIPDSN